MVPDLADGAPRTANSGVPAGTSGLSARESVYFPALDGLRAFSVLFVIFHHVENKTPALKHFQGFLGVDIFFVLSGFLITYLLRREYSQTSTIDLGSFYIRRFFRIVPIYAMVLLVYVVLSRFWGGAEKWAVMKSELPYFLTFMNDLNPEHAGGMPFSFSWTLGIEEKFYLVWPLLFFFAFKANRWRNLVTAGLYVSLLAATPFLPTMSRSYSGLLIGCFLGILLTGRYAGHYGSFVRRVPTIFTVLLTLVGFYLVDLDYWFVFLFSWFVFFLVSELVLKRTWLTSFLSAPLLVWIGKRSYAMYLLHGLCLDLVQKRIHLTGATQPLLCTFATFALAACVAEGTYRIVENPARKYGKLLTADREQRGNPALLVSAQS